MKLLLIVSFLVLNFSLIGQKDSIKYNVELYSGLMNSFRTLKLEKPETADASDCFDCRKSENSIYSPSFGVNYSMGIKGHEFIIGLQWSRFGFKVNGLDLSEVNASPAYFYEVCGDGAHPQLGFIAPGYYDLRFLFAVNNEGNQISNGDFSYVSDYIIFPFKYRNTIELNKFSFFSSVGCSITRNITNSSKLEIDEFNLVVENKNFDSERDWNIGLVLEIGSSFKINDAYEVGLTFQYNQMLFNSLFDMQNGANGVIKEIPYQYGLLLGVKRKKGT